ncbi:MAG: hypothetical protein Q4G05_02945 [Clostridia bacterium]|nr:hypothetical protein [Clostridia bacterium]
MNINKMKNVVVLKNLPSNIIEEAIVILKQNKKAVVFENKNDIDNRVDKDYINSKNGISSSKDYIVKEAELIIKDCIIGEGQKKERFIELQRKYSNLKKTTVTMLLIFILSMILTVML